MRAPRRRRQERGRLFPAGIEAAAEPAAGALPDGGPGVRAGRSPRRAGLSQPRDAAGAGERRSAVARPARGAPAGRPQRRGELRAAAEEPLPGFDRSARARSREVRMSMAETLQSSGGGGDSVSPGARLAEARQAQNLAPADVARQLKLSVWQVEALEAGLYQQLPGPVFVRGFIRNYARIVKLDPEELLRA